MKELSTLEKTKTTSMEVARGHLLQQLLLRLPDDKLRHILKSPRKEVVEKLKWKIHNSLLKED